MKRAEIVNELCAAIEQDRRSTFNLAQAAGVNYSTLYFWLSGRTSNPNIATLDKVARAVGKEVAFLDGQWTLRPVTTPASAASAAKRARMALWRLQ